MTDRRVSLWRVLFVIGIVAACLLSHTGTAHAFGNTVCAGERYGSDLNCTANDVAITGMRVIGDLTSCIGGTNITADLEITVNFATPDRWDIGIFISNDGKTPQLLQANGGAASCSVGILPISSPFLNLDGPTDTCGDGNKDISGGTGSGILYMTNVTVPCQALAGSGGNLYIPFVVSWDNQKTPPGATCTSIADPVPNTSSKCNSPTIAQGTVSVVVLPTITNTDGRTTVSSGETVNYTVVIRNTTEVALSNIVFKDPAVTNINVSSVSCSFSGGATCPGTVTVAGMQGAGLTIPSMPVNSTVTFTVTATLVGTPPNTLTNTASVIVGSQTNSASDTDTIVGTIAILPTSLSKNGTLLTWVVYNYTLYNFGGSADTISLYFSPTPSWDAQIWNASETAQISSIANVAGNGGSADFIVKVEIPAGATLGTVNITTVRATSGNNPSKKATATAVTTVGSPLTLTPDNEGAGGKGSSVFYNHRVQNNTDSNQTVTFSTTFLDACTGWTKGVYKSDKITPIPPATVTLAPFGGYEDIVVKVTIPSGAAAGDVCRVNATATAGTTASATDTTTVKDIVLYADPDYTKESYIYPAGNSVYARAFGALALNYRFYWYDSNNVLKRTSPNRTGPGTLPDTYDIPVAGPLGTWRVEVWRVDGSGNPVPPRFAQTDFYVGPDHINATYTGSNPSINTNATVNLSLHDKYNHVVPLDPLSGNVIQGNPPSTKDPLKITVTVSGSATIVSTTLLKDDGSCCATITGQAVTGRLDTVIGTAAITITDSNSETVIITPSSYNSALYGSPLRDESATVTFVNKKIRIVDWREVIR